MFGFSKNKRGRYFLKFFFAFALFSGWIFWGGTVEKAEATVTTVYATSNSADGSLTGWTNPTYAYTDDGSNFATRAGSVKNTWYGTLYGFDLSGIPDGSIINSVTITAEWKNSANDTSGPVLYLGAQSGGSEVGTGTSDTSGQTTFELVTNSPAGLTAADLKATGASGFWAILRFRRTDNTAHTASVDYVKVVVDYTAVSAPTITLSAATNKEATTATLNGNVTATGGENPTVTVYWGDNDGGQVAGDWDNSSTPTSPGQPQGVAAFYSNVTNLPTGTTIYFSAKATNAGGTSWPASSLSFLTKPAAPTNVAATDGTLTDKVTITWTKSTGATDYHVWRDSTDLGVAGDVATFDDTGAGAPSITAGSAVASDGTSAVHVALSLSGASFNNGTTHTYKVVASNATGNSADSATNTGYRGYGTPSYQWQRSAADSDASYSDVTGATAATYNDTDAPADGSARYYKCILSSTGVPQQTSTADRGYKGVISITIEAGSGTVTYGTVAVSQDTTTSGVNQTQTVRNSGNVVEDFDIKGQHSADWTLGAAAGNGIYKHEWCTQTCDATPVWNAMTTTYDSDYLAAIVAPDGIVDFDLKVTVPTSNAGTNQQNVDVFVRATQH